MTENLFNYWHWFFKGIGAKPGYCRVIDKWLLGHVLVGIIISLLVQTNLGSCSNTVLLPLVGILIGLSFAWASNAQALMQTAEVGLLSEYREGGFVEYVYSYQTAILTILVTLIFWGLAGLDIFDKRWPMPTNAAPYFVVKAVLFTLASLTLRSCWQVILAAQWMLLAQKKVKELYKKNE